MKTTLTTFFLVAATFLGLSFINATPTAAALPYMCGVDGFFTAPSSGQAALTSSDTNRIAQANNWLAGMTKTKTVITTPSTIGLTQNYTNSYTGAIRGNFNLQGASYPTVNDASISISNPTGSIVDSYRGPVTGQVLETPTPWRWIIQAYKRTDSGISQVAVQTLADGVTGAFTIDVSAVSPAIDGEWMFGLLDANAGYAPHGEMWPTSPRYTGLEVQHLVVTDTEYFWASQPARTSGEFYFANSSVGNKMVRLVDTATNDVLAEYIRPTGLVRSYQYAVGETGYGTGLENQSFVYDQALALFAAIASGNTAQASLLAQGLLQLQTTSGIHTGGFIFAAPQFSPALGDAMYRTGAHAIATDALLAYIEANPTDAQINTYKAAAVDALDFLASTLDSSGGTYDGLYKGGFGSYSGMPQVFQPNTVIEWASTEHNLDSWHALQRAARVLNNNTYHQASMSLEFAINTKLRSSDGVRFNQGINGGNPDIADPLDVNTWGSIYSYATNQVDYANQQFARKDAFAFTQGAVSGYTPFYAAGGYPGATPTVWFEGSFGAVLAAYRLGDLATYRSLLTSLEQGQEADGSFRYATTEDALYEISRSKSVAATAWYIIATSGRSSIWNTCRYVAPPSTPNTGLALLKNNAMIIGGVLVAGSVLVASRSSRSQARVPVKRSRR